MNTRKLFLVVIGLVLVLGILPFIVSAQEKNVACPDTMAVVASNTQPVNMQASPDDTTVTGILPANAEVVVLNAKDEMFQVCMNVGQGSMVGWVNMHLFDQVAPAAQPEATQAVEVQPLAEMQLPEGVTLDGDEQICDTEKCSLDIGVNDYSGNQDSTVLQIGYAWGSPVVSWSGHFTEGDKGFVTMTPGFFLDMTLPGNGGVRVYNYPKSWTQQQVDQLTSAVLQEVFGGSDGVDSVVWTSDALSINNSAAGAEGVGLGDNYPQLDSQQFSCQPEKGTCIRNISVAETRQVALVFGVQIDYMQLQGPKSNDLQQSLRDTQYRCDMVVLTPGTFSNFDIYDARVEVYNVPEFDQAGWFRNLVGERAEEQSVDYACPQRQSVPIWNADGTYTQEYTLRWDGNKVVAVGGPQDISSNS